MKSEIGKHNDELNNQNAATPSEEMSPEDIQGEQEIPEGTTGEGDEPDDTDGLIFSEEFDIEQLKGDYKIKNFLKLGFEDYKPFIDTSAAKDYLLECGFGDSGLKQARDKINDSALIHEKISVNEEGAHYCDFCGKKLGAEYDVLNDGRERCYQCSKTVVKTVDELREVFVEVIKNMEALFGITYFAEIDVKTVSAKKIARKLGIRFKPSPQFDGRVLGYASHVGGGYNVCIENQSPYLCAVSTMAHELTHIWQYLNWKSETYFRIYYYPKLRRMFPGISPRKIVYEGMAKWIEIQYLFLINERDRAYLEAAATLQREDEYGYGLALYMDQYEFSEDIYINGVTPFDNKDKPLSNLGGEDEE